MTRLDAATVAAVDPSGQARDILDLPEHLRDAIWRVESAGIPASDSTGLVVAGMGGSAVGGRLARAVLGRRLERPMLLFGGYDLPPFVDSKWTVLCSSYSGGTEETLTAYDVARKAGARRIVATTGGDLAEEARADGVPVIPLPGGFQPRAAIGYAIVTAMEVAAVCGVAPKLHDEIEAGARAAEERARRDGPDGPDDSGAKALAIALAGRIPVVYGAELTAPIAYRWKTQINENAKLPAFSAELPEAAHNEVEGWADGERFAPVFLEDPDTNPRTLQRMKVMSGWAASSTPGLVPHHISEADPTRMERLVSLVLTGDLVSLYLAVLNGTDPATIRGIDAVKKALAER